MDFAIVTILYFIFNMHPEPVQFLCNIGFLNAYLKVPELVGLDIVRSALLVNSFM